MSWFRKKPKDYGVIHITPYMIVNLNDSVPEDILAICRKIAARLNEYEGKMVEYGKKTDLYMRRLQMISADYDTKTQEIAIRGSGSKCFSWSGKLDDFLAGELRLTKP